MPGERILIVEDDERIGATLLRALDGSGYEARWESTGLGALTAVAARRPDLVLLDLGLPDMDGLEVCREIHRGDSTIDVVMLTARDEELDVVVGLDAGAIDYITKPFKLAELLARLRAQFRRAEPRAESRASAGDLIIDGNARRAWLHGDELVPPQDRQAVHVDSLRTVRGWGARIVAASAARRRPAWGPTTRRAATR